ncbi:adhesion G -coupled receptor E3-like protein [Labeo rohita]|uniref:Adhesion G-coupled receptor E3-like protein n=1 Tax=Labeo rohita TaxID=84645 RepID=A0A498P0P5_LABRO|nr:adhesion G -coupled receptor E3-like protein [Labeo rohita]
MTPERIRAGGTTRSGTGPYQSPLEQRNWSRTDKDYGPGLDPVQTLPSQTSGGCFQNLLEQIENITAQVLPLNNVTNILTVAFNASEKILVSLSSAKPTELASYGNHMLKTSEKLISTLVKPTVTSDNVSFTLATVDASETGLGAVLTQKRRQDKGGQQTKYEVIEDKLYLKTLSDNHSHYRIFLPRDLISPILEHYHSDPTSGHAGIFKTYKRIQEVAFWPGIGTNGSGAKMS